MGYLRRLEALKYGVVSFFFFNFLFYIGVQLINNVVLVSGVQQSDSVIHIHVPILFQILFKCSGFYIPSLSDIL